MTDQIDPDKPSPTLQEKYDLQSKEYEGLLADLMDKNRKIKQLKKLNKKYKQQIVKFKVTEKLKSE